MLGVMPTRVLYYLDMGPLSLESFELKFFETVKSLPS